MPQVSDEGENIKHRLFSILNYYFERSCFAQPILKPIYFKILSYIE